MSTRFDINFISELNQHYFDETLYTVSIQINI